MWRALAIPAMLIALAPATAKTADDAAIEALDARLVAPTGVVAPMTQWMRTARVAAVSVAFIENGRVKWTRSYGDTASGGAVTADTRFQAASLSKAVAAASALALVDRGTLALDEDVAPRIAGWPAPLVTLRALLSHTAGLTVDGYPGYAADVAVPTIVQSLNGVAPANTPAVRAFVAPGGAAAYSGGGYSAAQLLMSQASGEGFATLAQRLVLTPAGMTRSDFDQTPAPRDAAEGHDAAGRPILGGSNAYPELAAAGLWTTPTDYARFLIALQDSWVGRPGALLSQASARAMTTPVSTGYALGVGIPQAGGRTAIAHGGANAGYVCSFFAFLDGSRQGLVVMTDGDGGGALSEAVRTTIARAYGWPATAGSAIDRAPDAPATAG